MWEIKLKKSKLDWELFAITAWNLWSNRNSVYHGEVFKEMGSSGVGVVIRNKEGQIMGAMSKRLDLPLKVLETEVEAIEEGIILARDLSLRNISVESDAQVVVKSLNAQGLALSLIHKVIEGTKIKLCGFDSWEVNHICKAKNSATHLMAKHAKFISDCCVWVEDTPPVIANQILYDVAQLSIILS